MKANSLQIEAQRAEEEVFGQFEVKRWLQGKAEGTKVMYVCAMKAFMEHTGLSPKQMVDEAERDREKSTRDRGLPEYRVQDFHSWLLTDYVLKAKGRSKEPRQESKKKKKGTSKNLAHSYAATICGFYRANGFPLKTNLPKTAPKKENFKLAIRVPEIKKLLNATTNLRDKAVILTLFQSGMSIRELCNINYGDVANGLDTNEEPLHLHLIRQKEQVEYDCFIGADAIEAIKAYLSQRKREGEVLSPKTPLFATLFTTDPKYSKHQRIYPQAIETFVKSASLKAGIVTQEQIESADFNPARPHSIRTAFISILKMAGMNDTLVEYLCGHTISPTDQAYFRLTVDELRKTYKQYEKHLSLTNSVDAEKLEQLEKKAVAMQQESTNNQGIVTALLENGRNKDSQIASVTGLLSQIQDSLNKLNNEMDYHRLEDVARFVMAKAPTRDEMTSFLNRRLIGEGILRRTELQCIAFSLESQRWVYDKENDIANLLTQN